MAENCIVCVKWSIKTKSRKYALMNGIRHTWTMNPPPPRCMDTPRIVAKGLNPALPSGNMYNIKYMEHYQLSTGRYWDQIIMLHGKGFVLSHYV